MSAEPKAAADASKKARPDEPVKFVEKLNDFLRNNRKAFLIGSLVVAVSVVTIGIVSAVAHQRLVKSTAALEAAEAGFDEWIAMETGDAKTAAADALLADAEDISARYRGSYADLRASVIKARVLYERKDYAGSEAAYASIAETAPESHLAPISLMNAAAMAEERGDPAAAQAHMAKALERYPDAPGTGRTLFSLGRVLEGMKSYGEAMEYYGRLVATGEDSDWTKLARDRIIFLKSAGLAQ